MALSDNLCILRNGSFNGSFLQTIKVPGTLSKQFPGNPAVVGAVEPAAAAMHAVDLAAASSAFFVWRPLAMDNSSRIATLKKIKKWKPRNYNIYKLIMIHDFSRLFRDYYY